MLRKQLAGLAALFMLAASFSFYGCLSAGPQFVKPGSPAAGRSIVYFYRTNNMYTNTSNPGIVHNGTQVLSDMYSQGYWKYEISVGDHLFEPSQFGIYKKGVLNLKNDRAGQIHYVEVVVSFGYIGFELKDEATGLREISECYEIDSKKAVPPSSPQKKAPQAATPKPVETKPVPAVRKAPVSKPGEATLRVTAFPQNARVRIMNIKPKFHQGIRLAPGRYQLEISAKGYYTELEWVSVKAGENATFDFNLVPKPGTVQAEQVLPPVKKSEPMPELKKKSGIKTESSKALNLPANWAGTITGKATGDIEMTLLEKVTLSGSDKVTCNLVINSAVFLEGFSGVVKGKLTGFIEDGNYNATFLGRAETGDGDSVLRGRFSGRFSQSQGSGIWHLNAEAISTRYNGKWQVTAQ